MPKKGRRTKEDAKGDAFERLYALLMATNQNLPALEETHLVVVEKKVETQSQEEIDAAKAKEAAKEKAEFDKLFAQLSSLSTRRSAETQPSVSKIINEPVIAPELDKIEHPLIEVPLIEVPPIEVPLSQTPISKVEQPLEKSSNEFDEIYEQILRIISMKSQMVQTAAQVVAPIAPIAPVVAPVVEPVRKKVKPMVAKPIVTKPVVEIILECGACKKIFSTKGSLTRHQQTTATCQSWLALPEEKKIPMLDKPIHVIADDYLRKATTGEIPNQCRFCSVIFTNRGNHHKHYQTATTCNRMAYLEFKRLVAQ